MSCCKQVLPEMVISRLDVVVLASVARDGDKQVRCRAVVT